ncbi:hypothetical protein [Chryseobacterium sp.]|uniref:hypothetical protein n=1 Tax=Chryseobacterium sp. TaxID=1871047 RepID=UPI0028A006FE|nr:hypothetical protein [Chryseobacterium sp.]
MNSINISAQNDYIDIILLGLKEISVGIGISELCDVSVKKGDYGSTIIFVPKGNVNVQDFFWFGYYLGRDYKLDMNEVTIVSEKEKRNKNSLKPDNEL